MTRATKHPSTLAEAVDQHVAARVRARRIEVDMTQTQLGDAIGVACAQARKYEIGQDRITAGRLFKMATALGVPVGYFFEGVT